MWPNPYQFAPPSKQFIQFYSFFPWPFILNTILHNKPLKLAKFYASAVNGITFGAIFSRVKAFTTANAIKLTILNMKDKLICYFWQYRRNKSSNRRREKAISLIITRSNNNSPIFTALNITYAIDSLILTRKYHICLYILRPVNTQIQFYLI